METVEQNQAVKALLETYRSHWIPEYQAERTDAELMGILVAKYFRWGGEDILKTASVALEDANFHAENTVVEGLLEALNRN